MGELRYCGGWVDTLFVSMEAIAGVRISFRVELP